MLGLEQAFYTEPRMDKVPYGILVAGTLFFMLRQESEQLFQSAFFFKRRHRKGIDAYSEKQDSLVYYGANPIPSSEAPMSIYTIAPDGSNRQWLCNTSNVVPPLSWSPDGKTIIFLAASPATGHLQVFSMPVDCSAPPKGLSDPQFDAFDPAFSPGGNYIAYVSTQYGNERIFLMNANGSNSFDITNDVHLNDQPAWQKGLLLPAP